MKPYNKSNIPHAKELQKNMTPWERKLWYLFLRRYPVRFQRQKAIGNYIADFYCAKAQLVIELDGSGHFQKQQEAYDKQRSIALSQMGIKTIRINNIDIDRHFKVVCETIDLAVRRSLPQSPMVTGADSARHSLSHCDISPALRGNLPLSEGAMKPL